MATAQLTGWPAKVNPCRNDAPGPRKGSMRRSEAIMAPRGAYPEVSPFATVMMSGW